MESNLQLDHEHKIRHFEIIGQRQHIVRCTKYQLLKNQYLNMIQKITYCLRESPKLLLKLNFKLNII
jgi:hypothetical protein